MSELYIGVMSGTSLDGIDVCMCEIDATSCTLLHGETFAFDSNIKKAITNAITSKLTLQEFGSLDASVGAMFAHIINTFIHKYNIDISTVKAIGLHGQTVWHEPSSKHPFSLQIGSPSYVYALTRIKVVSDFRNIDIAFGGQGAPLAPAFHQHVFQNIEKELAIVNIGGMANITLFQNKLTGWDTGPGNILLDYWMQKTNLQPFDTDGNYARSGTLNDTLLKLFLQDPYFSKHPPKSTGREYFNAKWIESCLKHCETLQSADVQRTLLELTAKSIADSLDKSIEIIVICGGGAKNKFLLERLKKISDKEVTISNDFGIDSDFMEAMAFAWLAYKKIHGEIVDISDVTGAKQNAVLGGLYG